ncbi:MAG: glycoside hydrolase family 3 N-terminal domain-containing protein, partial [Omnitrophica WOR_2 bacterium]
VHDECCSGFMARAATLFPQMIGLASTWEPELAEAMTGIVRRQMRSVGVHQGLAPVLDVNRDPRWGRVEETYGEDPYLAASMGAAYVRGLQGGDLRQGVAATSKHFATYGNPEGGLNWSPAHLGPRELREVFLFSFEAAVKEAGLASVMNAYHEIDGVPCGASHELLTEILRGEWGFDGIVASDYNTVQMLMEYHHLAETKAEAAKLALEAGLDVELPGTDCYGEPLRQAMETGQVDMAVLDEAVRRVLSLKFRLGLFDDPYVDAEQAPRAYDQPEQIELARRIAQKSIVLLKNENNLLPLDPNLGSIAVIGPNADAIRHMVGDYSYPAFASLIAGSEAEADQRFPGRFPATMISILEAVRSQVSPATAVRYAQGCTITGASREGFAEAVQAAHDSDVAVLVVGGKSGLTVDCTCGELRDRANLGLPGMQEELVHAVLDTGKPVVLLIVDGRPAAIPGLVERVPAIFEAWLPGQEGGRAAAEVLFGKVNPGGRLPASFPRSAGQIPVFYGRKPSGGRSYQFEDYVDMPVKPLFPFGFGLSYTQFEYSDLNISPEQVSPDGKVKIQVKVKNTGKRLGDEVVQLYLRDLVASVTRPIKELKGFRRVTLEPGETCRVTFTVFAAQMAFYNLQMQYVVEPGKVEVMVGSSSDDIRLRGQFEIAGAVTPITKKIFFSQNRIEP